jgi:peptidoglycan/xylan/chitin deacetylase (PgdA/CDA1 family)
MYHAVMEPPIGCDEVERDLFVSPGQFEAQMADLADRGFRSVTLDRFHQANDAAVLITFDDAYAHVPETVTPILKRHGFVATMFVPAAHLGGRNAWDGVEHPRLAALDIANADQIRSMAAGPWEIASHGWRHVDLRGVEANLRLGELANSRAMLSEISGRPVNAFAYPYGYVDDQVERAARAAGYTMAFEAGPGPGANPWRLPRQPIRGSDNLGLFRLRASGWLGRFHGMQRIAPAWARTAARAALNEVMARKR